MFLPLAGRADAGNPREAGSKNMKNEGVANKTASLPIYRDCLRLTDQLMVITPTFPKTFRFNLGERLVNMCLDMLELVNHANSSFDKGPLLQQLLDRQHLMVMLLRLSAHHRLISVKQHVELSQLLDSIGRQGGGMLKHFGGTAVPSLNATTG